MSNITLQDIYNYAKQVAEKSRELDIMASKLQGMIAEYEISNNTEAQDVVISVAEEPTVKTTSKRNTIIPKYHYRPCIGLGEYTGEELDNTCTVANKYGKMTYIAGDRTCIDVVMHKGTTICKEMKPTANKGAVVLHKQLSEDGLGKCVELCGERYVLTEDVLFTNFTMNLLLTAVYGQPLGTNNPYKLAFEKFISEKQEV